jgi:SAM-dependent methyltransferase
MYEQIARFYDLTHDALSEDIPLVLQLAREAEGAVLELGCGTGRLLLPLAQAGCRVVGVDNSRGMLARATVRLAQAPEMVRGRVTLLAQDFRQLTVEQGVFSLAVIPYNTFLHLETAAKRAVLRLVRGCLGENGRLFLDMTNPFWLAEMDEAEPEFVLEDELIDPQTGETVRQWSRGRVEAEAQTVRIEWRYEVVGGEETAVSATYHYLFPHELELLLRQAGFRLQQVWGDYDATPFAEEQPRLLILAAKASQG